MAAKVGAQGSRVSWRGKHNGPLLVLAAIMVLSGALVETGRAANRRSSVATLNSGGIVTTGHFCIQGGTILVTHACRGQDAMSTCSIGQTLLTGASTQRLSPGTHPIPSGCYDHQFANTTVVAAATAVSTVWYDSP